MSALRTSPLHEALATLRPEWGELNGMAVALRFPASGGPALELADLSAYSRTGLKGPRAADWLRAQGVAVPQQPNSWLPLDGGGLIARLARTEFLIEDGPDSGCVQALSAALETSAPDVFPVLRQDAALLLRGRSVQELLAQTCNVNFAAIPSQERTVCLTSMVGVAVTVINTALNDSPCYRVWCDNTYSEYLWDTCLSIATELGGGAVGLAAVLPAGSAAVKPQILKQ